jgi:hypothetical protein
MKLFEKQGWIFWVRLTRFTISANSFCTSDEIFGLGRNCQVQILIKTKEFVTDRVVIPDLSYINVLAYRVYLTTKSNIVKRGRVDARM